MKKRFEALAVCTFIGLSAFGLAGCKFRGRDSKLPSNTSPISTTTPPTSAVDETVTIHFDTNGGEAVEPIEASKEDGCTLPSPTKDGYKFDGWYDNGELTGEVHKAGDTYRSAVDITLYAKWTELVTYELTYTKAEDGNSYAVTGYTGDPVAVVIPQEYNSLPVTSIGDSAFDSCTDLTSITIPSSLKSIKSNAFWRCDKLEAVHISDLKSWCEIAFVNSNSNPLHLAHNLYLNDKLVTELVIPDSVTSISSSSFSRCTGLKNITIGSGVTSIGSYAFRGCTGLTSITVDEGNTKYSSAGNCIIETATKTLVVGCKGSIIPADGSVTSIGGSAFYDCSSLTGIDIPASVTSIGDYAFSDCTGLTDVAAGNGVTSIGAYAFKDCTGLTSINISSSVTSIDKNAFFQCNGLNSITVDEGNTKYHSDDNCIIETASRTLVVGCKESNIPADGSVTSIGENAFYGQTELISINIPKSVKSIGKSAFNSCTKLTSIRYGGTKEEWDEVTKREYWDNQTGNYEVTFTEEGIDK